MDERIKQALIRIIGKKNISDALIDRITSSMDFSDYRHDPTGTVWPTSTKQVSQILKLANQERIPVTPRGAGTGATGMAVPIQGGIVLDLVRMNKILNISIEDRLAVVQPGVVYADLQKALFPCGFCFPPDPASGKVATIGGNVATNAGGIKGAKYGTTRDYVLGLEVVLPDGRVMRTGGSCMKSVSGFDLTRLLVGSEGVLGVITEIRLKINPIPTASATALAAFDQLANAGQAVSQVMHSGIIPSVCKILDRYTINLLLDHTEVDLPRCEALILVETDGYTQEEAAFQMGKIVEVFKNNQAIHIKEAASAAEAAGLWQARKSLGGEHGIGLSKASFMSLEHDPVALDVMASLKKLFDPNNILNPGKMGFEDGVN
ncbi:MAG: FAD-binding protein [Desulfobacca sp.]|nr:FAD-binding protein [Desulfobacca sp.]